jgi:hypothetical protein
VPEIAPFATKKWGFVTVFPPAKRTGSSSTEFGKFLIQSVFHDPQGCVRIPKEGVLRGRGVGGRAFFRLSFALY